jgi:hypothetical protein
VEESEEKGERRKEFKFLAKFYWTPLFDFLIRDTTSGEKRRSLNFLRNFI